jgi:hypothetical protein
MTGLARRLLMASARLPYDKVVLASGPYAYWRLDETAGTVAKDSSGHNRDGTYTGSVTLGGGALLPAVKGAYLVLAASNAYVDVSGANQFCAGAAWSIECWINVASYSNLPVGGYANQQGCRILGNVIYNAAGWQAGLEWGIQSINGSSPSSYRYYDFPHAWAPAFTPPGVGVLQHVFSFTAPPDSRRI